MLKRRDMGIISVEGMQFYAYHGCFKEEQVIGTHFTVDLSVETDTKEAELTDDLNATVNYQELFLLVSEEMGKPSRLLEHVARRILDRINKEFPSITSSRIKISKLNPPLGGQVGSVSVELRA